jgi:hypothetical protein
MAFLNSNAIHALPSKTEVRKASNALKKNIVIVEFESESLSDVREKSSC